MSLTSPHDWSPNILTTPSGAFWQMSSSSLEIPGFSSWSEVKQANHHIHYHLPLHHPPTTTTATTIPHLWQLVMEECVDFTVTTGGKIPLSAPNNSEVLPCISLPSLPCCWTSSWWKQKNHCSSLRILPLASS